MLHTKLPNIFVLMHQISLVLRILVLVKPIQWLYATTWLKSLHDLLIFVRYVRLYHFTRFCWKILFGKSLFLNLWHSLLSNVKNRSIYMINTLRNTRSQPIFRELSVDWLFGLLFWILVCHLEGNGFSSAIDRLRRSNLRFKSAK